MPEKGSEQLAEAQAGKQLLCFVAAPIGAADSEQRKKSDQVLKHVLRKALEPEFKVERADHIDRPGVITVQVVQRIFDADLVIADLTDRNPNVYYELAIRHAARKPTIHIISRGQDIPFDVQDMRVVPYDLTDPDSLEDAVRQLREYVKAIQQGEPVITPVQFAQILRSFEAGENRDAQVRALFESLSTGISNLQQGIGEVVQDLRQRKMAEMWPNNLASYSSFPTLLSAVPPASGFNFPSKSAERSELTTAQDLAAKIKKRRDTDENK